MKRVLVTGAAGRVGANVARRLAGEQLALRLLFRSTPAPPAPADAQVVVGDYNDPMLMASAFESVDSVFMYAPLAEASSAVFKAAAAAGVRHVTLLSSASVTRVPPGTNPIAERHRAAENAALASGLGCTLLRPDTMASNCLQWGQTIRDERRVYTAYPESMRNPVHEDDIALLAAQSLLGTGFDNCAFEITGPASITIREQVAAIAARLGTALDCVAIPVEQTLLRMTAPSTGLSPESASRLLEYQKKSVTLPPRISGDFEKAVGHPPRRFEAWVDDNIDFFRPPNWCKLRGQPPSDKS